ncbi:MAG: hypothetical protein IPK62_08630, partial [Bacteroidetes bacterium]|nr:hypothetical protein [Bacteroidota bacterium]
FDFAKYASAFNLFLLVGFGIALLVQSGSVTMALTLSALHFGAVDFYCRSGGPWIGNRHHCQNYAEVRWMEMPPRKQVVLKYYF